MTECETNDTTSATIHKAYDALGFVVLGGKRAGSATKFSNTHVILHETSVKLLPLGKTDHMSKEHVLTSAEPR